MDKISMMIKSTSSKTYKRSTVNDKTPSGQEKRNQKRQARRKTTTHSKHSLPSARGGHMIFHSFSSLLRQSLGGDNAVVATAGKQPQTRKQVHHRLCEAFPLLPRQVALQREINEISHDQKITRGNADEPQPRPSLLTGSSSLSSQQLRKCVKHQIYAACYLGMLALGTEQRHFPRRWRFVVHRLLRGR